MFDVIIAGDTHRTTFVDRAYPSDTWALRYVLAGPSTVTSVASAEADGSYVLTLTAAQTTVLKEGVYQWALKATKDAEVYTVRAGLVKVKPNLATGGNRVFIAQRMVELIEAHLAGQLSEGMAVEASSIAGRSITLLNRTELLAERAKWREEVDAYKAAASGQGSIKSIRLMVGSL